MKRCKCCLNNTKLYGVCDFGKTTADGDDGVVSNKTGISIQYYRCRVCGFVFTNQFDSFSHNDFRKNIYDDTYALIDPDSVEKRPKANAKFIENLFFDHKDTISILDFGGGGGVLSAELARAGFSRVESYDPFLGKQTMPDRRFNLVLAFEVVEHVVDPYGTFSTMHDLLNKDNGLIVFSTLIQPENIESLKTRWWYISPRNGHISIHTQKSLEIVLQRLGMRYLTATQDLHCSFVKMPFFAKHIIK